MLQAFQLWITDESLHESNLCLSALEPKYCPDRLELILKGDQVILYYMHILSKCVIYVYVFMCMYYEVI